MSTVKVGMFPGEVKEYVVEESMTVQDALDLAGLSVGAEQEVKADGEVVNMTDTASSYSIILVTKRLKGAF